MAIPTLACKTPPINSSPILSKLLSCIRAGCKFCDQNLSFGAALTGLIIRENVVDDMDAVFLGRLA